MKKVISSRVLQRRARIKVAVIGAMCVLLILIAIFAKFLVPHDPNATSALMIRRAPSAEYPFGADSFGRCVLSRVLSGARTTIFATCFLVAVTFAVGTVLGIVCGYYGGAADEIIMRITELFLKEYFPASWTGWRSLFFLLQRESRPKQNQFMMRLHPT